MNFYIVTLLAIFTSYSASAFELTSQTLVPNQQIPNDHVFNRFGCTGENFSPALSWKDVPAGTKSFAITVTDIDATGAEFFNWMLINIPAGVSSIRPQAGNPRTQELPEGALQIRNSYGIDRYSGPCPPKGNSTHRFAFRLHALASDKLELNGSARTKDVINLIKEKELGMAEIIVIHRNP